MTKPPELVEAELVLGLAERFGCPPHEVYRWPAATLRLVRIEQLGNPPERD